MFHLQVDHLFLRERYRSWMLEIKVKHNNNMSSFSVVLFFVVVRFYFSDLEFKSN